MKQHKIFSKAIISALIAAMALSGCSGQPTATSTPAPSAQAGTSPIITASGEVVPAQWTTLSFAQAGNVDELAVKEGDAIKKGDVIARLSAPELQANLAQKQATVKVAEASLAQLTAPARAEDIRAAEEAVNSAQAVVTQTLAQRDLLYKAISKADIMQAETQVYAIQTQKQKLDDAMQSIIDKGGFALRMGEPVGNQQKYAELELIAAQQVLDDLMAGLVEGGRQVCGGDGHAHAGRKPLAKRTGGGLHAGSQAIFRMPRRPAFKLPEIFDFVQRQVITCQMEQGVEKHRAMPTRKDEPVPSHPFWIAGVMA